MSYHQFFKAAGAVALLFFCSTAPVLAQIKTRPPVKVGPVTPAPDVPIDRNECLKLKADIQKHAISEAPCCYKITLRNGLGTASKLAPWAFQVELKYGSIIQVYGALNTWKQNPAVVPPRTSKVKWQYTAMIPAGPLNLATVCIETDRPSWLHYAWLDRTGKILCRDSMLINDCLYEYESACKNPLIQNGEFTPSAAANQPPTFWGLGYGAPKFLNTPGEGCFDPGYAELSGNQTSGDAIVQQLAPTNKLLKGKKYVLQVAVKFKQTHGGPDYCRLRAVAWNTTLGFAGTHPGPGANMAIIGRSGKIRTCSDWSIVEFPVWVANKDFQNIGISAFTNDNAVSKIWIDNVSLCETSDSDPCEELTLDAQGTPLAPAGLGNRPAGITCPPVEVETDSFDNGSLMDLYGQLYGYDGTTNWYAQASDKCFSLGGTIPAEVDKFNCDDSLKVLGITITCDDLEKGLANPDLSAIPQIRPPKLPVIPAPNIGACDGAPPPNFVEMPFRGRDIIFIHGLQLDHLCDRANGVKGAQANWPDPATQQEFYSGYYNSIALANFMPHILHYLQQQGHKNRYLVVSYNCSQSAEIAAHCVLTQIREAMETGQGVIMQDPNDPRGTSCFGREYIFISHSTGALVADIALAIADMTKTNAFMKAKWGDIGLLSDRCKGRVSFRGAFGGSDLATLMVAFQKNPELSKFASGKLTKNICHKDFSSAVDRNMVMNSVLVDLVPKVSQARWDTYLQKVPVPVVEISSGHPTDIVPFLKYKMHPGFDDGVLAMDCSSGNSMTAVARPSRFRASQKSRVFDMGQPVFRAINYYRDQIISGSDFASGCTPYLSPTGMVQPVAQVLSAAARYGNHYTFIQSASEHWLEDDYTSGKYEPTLWEKSPNWEEELVVEDASLYSKGIINPGIIGETSETVKEKVIYYPVFRIKVVKGIPKPIIVWKKFYVWKRTYHTLRDQNWYDYDYAYKYLFRN